MEYEEIKKKAFSTKDQLEKLVSLMEQNPLIAKGITKKNDAELKWKTFADDLNSLGPPIKTAEKWTRVWIDLKAKVKKKLVHNKKEIHSTGGGPCNLLALNALEKKISEFLNLEVCINPPGRHLGLNDEENAEAETENIFENDIENTAPITPAPRVEECSSNANNFNTKRRKTNILEEKAKLLENHIEEFKILRNDICDIKEYLKSMAEYKKKMYYLKKDKAKELINLKKEKLKIYKEEVEKKQKDRALKCKLKIELLELQKKEFERSSNS